MRSPSTELDDDYTRTGDSFLHSVSSLQMPRAPSDSDSDNEEFSLGLVPDRSAASSTVSMEPQERLEALQRANTELGRKLVEAEQTLQNKLSEHEMELEEMQSRLEEVRSELSATKREEKELRSKEVCWIILAWRNTGQ
jgi:predicted RNase H-like nuclease (RuvC/YqgF family)